MERLSDLLGTHGSNNGIEAGSEKRTLPYVGHRHTLKYVPAVVAFTCDMII